MTDQSTKPNPPIQPDPNNPSPLPPKPQPQPAGGMVDFIKQVWASVRNNPIFVAFYSATAGAAVSMLQDELQAGHIDWSINGVHKLVGYAGTAGLAAVVHLYVTPPGANPKAGK